VLPDAGLTDTILGGLLSGAPPDGATRLAHDGNIKARKK
jgi:hypothetical protein